METLVYTENKYVPAYDLCRYYGVRRVSDVPFAARRLKRIGLHCVNFQAAVYADWEATVGRSIPANRIGRSSLKYQDYDYEAALIQKGCLPGLVKYGKAPADPAWVQEVLNQYMVNGDTCVLEQLLQYAKDQGVLGQLQLNRELYTERLHNAINCVGILRKYGLFN